MLVGKTLMMNASTLKWHIGLPIFCETKSNKRLTWTDTVIISVSVSVPARLRNLYVILFITYSNTQWSMIIYTRRTSNVLVQVHAYWTSYMYPNTTTVYFKTLLFNHLANTLIVREYICFNITPKNSILDLGIKQQFWLYHSWRDWAQFYRVA